MDTAGSEKSARAGGRLLLDVVKRRFGRSTQHVSVDAESRPVARAIPRTLDVVPPDEASHVRTRCGLQCEDTVLAPICRDILTVVVDDFPVTAPHASQRTALSTGKSIAHQVVRVVGVLFDVVPGAPDLLAIDVEQVGPWVATIEHSITHHHAGQRPERHPVAGIAGAGKL